MSRFPGLAAILIASSWIVGCGPIPEGLRESASQCGPGQTRFTSAKEMGIVDPTFGGASLAQSFQADGTLQVLSVSAHLRKKGTLANSFTLGLRIETDDRGTPSGNLASSEAYASIALSSVSTVASFVRFPLQGAVELTAGKTYWIKITGDYLRSSDNLVLWSAFDGSSGGLDPGRALYEISINNWSGALIGGQRDLAFFLGC